METKSFVFVVALKRAVLKDFQKGLLKIIQELLLQGGISFFFNL